MTFEKWWTSAPHRAKYAYVSPAYLAAKEAWEAATAAERERAARVCDKESNRDDLTGDYRYGAGICAAAIRAG